MLNANEKELGRVINSSPACQAAGISAIPGDTFGVVILGDGKPMALWSFFDGAFQLRSLASWDAMLTVNDLEAVLSETLSWRDRIARRTQD